MASSLSVPSERSGASSNTKKKTTELIAIANTVIEMLKRPGIKAAAEAGEVDGPLEFGLRGILNEIFTENVRRDLAWRIPVIDENTKTGAMIGTVNDHLDKLSKLYGSQVEFENAIPPPSQYAKHPIWAEWQGKDNAILCFRPSGKQGLPLCVLDNVFREFQQQVTAPLPSTEIASPAMEAALKLCLTMPNNFATESERGDAFDRCLDPILSRALWRKEVQIRAPTERRGGKVDGTYEKHGVVCILREDKLETGIGDDVYMQVSRVYQLYVEDVRSKNPSLFMHGVPVFLLCVLGPMLLICGGFHDTESTIVEPLAEPCLMFDDHRHVRQTALARQLLALKRATDSLFSRGLFDWDTEHHPPPGVPRVYTTYTTEDNTEQSLRFLCRLEESLPRSLLFIAIDNPPSESESEKKLVKLVEKYGVQVHRLLAQNQLAPVLYGQRSLESAPTAYIMQFLSPPTITEPGWVTLFEFFKDKELATRCSQAIWIEIERILKVMEEAEVVHGDLRPNNIMLEVDHNRNPVWSGEQHVNLKVVDFDWAGQLGVVKYPLHRNRDIAWPGGAGERINAGDDRKLAKTWWGQQFSSVS